jgi:dihydrofolate synthase / folylpolyglutamate synthase
MLERVMQSKDAWLNYLESGHAKSIDLGLDRIKRVAERLEVLQFDCPVITVAGTNGKGSCVALTQAILMAAGCRVGVYTSPHLLEYNERIQLAGKLVSDAALCEAFNQIEKERDEVSLSYFEFTTLAALLLFKHARLDAIILEVGLGGRLDAVNCVEADIAVISMVDLDHQEWLGHTREQIAKEKAGIMRPNKPCIFGDFTLPESVGQQASSLNVPLYCQGEQFDYKKQDSTWLWKSQQQTLTQLPLPTIDLQNAATVLQVIELLTSRFSITRFAIEKGLAQVFLPGRFQTIEKQTTRFILDVAHNPAGGRCLAKRLAKESCSGKTYAVVGMLADKAITHTLAPLLTQIDHWYLADLATSRAATTEQLAQCLLELNPNASFLKFASPGLAVQHAGKALQKEDRILVFGSFHTVAFVLKLLESSTNEWLAI